ncbi:hypothetical protein EON78_02445 [bacterium]|nr:MAG: hypothetical protein EON78_02445 [bacterium]
MTSFKPDVKKQFIKRDSIDASKLIINLKDALIKNGIKDISNFNIVKLDTSYYYQVKTKNNDRLSYLSATDGSLKSNADSLYGIQLAKKILGDDGAVIKDVSLVRDFTDGYVYVNRYLPVYKISFNREDGIRIYIDTFGSRMALAMNDSRAGFNKFFINFHSWGFLDYFGNVLHLQLNILSSLNEE